jgi:predicted TIM-barrel fold metal-dependent hydrolase
MADNRLHWLSRTVEEVIDPNLPICDPHHHLWEFPEDRYLVDEFLADVTAGHRIERTVLVECHQKYRTAGPLELRPVGETEFMHHLTAALQNDSAATKVAAGIVAFADLTLGAAVQSVLEAHLSASGRLRGIRHASAWDPSDKIRNAHTDPPEGLLRRPEFRRGFERLRRLGLSFDAWVFHPQIPDVIDLAQAFPDVTIVLNHAGGPLGIGPYAGKRTKCSQSGVAIWPHSLHARTSWSSSGG